jgi:hypothetical protein
MEIPAFQAGGGYCIPVKMDYNVRDILYHGLFHGQCFPTCQPRQRTCRRCITLVLLYFLCPDRSPKSRPFRRDRIQLNVVQTVTYNHNLRRSEFPRVDGELNSIGVTEW